MKKILLFYLILTFCTDVTAQNSFKNEYLVYRDSLYVVTLGENLQMRYTSSREKYITDTLGNVINGPYDYSHIGNLCDGRMAVFRAAPDGWKLVKKNDNASYMDADGKLLMPFKYVSCGDFHSGRALVKRNKSLFNEKYGYIDTAMKRVVPLKYSDARNFKGRYAAVKKEDKWGVIDLKGKVILPFEYEGLISLYDGTYFKVERGGKYGVIDIEGNEILEPEYDFISCYGDKDAFVEVMDKEGNFMFDFLTKERSPIKYDYIMSLSGKLTRVDITKDVNKNGMADYKEYEQFKDRREGLMPVKKDGKWGYVDENFNVVISIIYDDVSEFKNGKALVCLDGKEYVIDKKGNMTDDKGEIKEIKDWKYILIIS